MLTFDRFVENKPDLQTEFSVTLPFESRQKSRLRVLLQNGEAVGIVLPRGSVMKDGDYLADSENRLLAIKAAEEAVSVVTCKNSLLFSRLCYHLGNRHVPLQILAIANHDSLQASYLSDHVLDQMIESLGGQVKHEMQIFEPESGAYHHHHD